MDMHAVVWKAVNFIRSNLAEDLDVEAVADAVNYSRFYFSRMFKAALGESPYRFARRLRLEWAANELRLYPGRSVTEIALEAGYSPSNFAVAFLDAFGQTPSEFRSDPRCRTGDVYSRINEGLRALDEQATDELLGRFDRMAEVRSLGEFFLHCRRYVGSYKGLPVAWTEFAAHAQTIPVRGERRYVGISYDNPLVTPERSCVYDLCIVVPDDEHPPCLRVPAHSWLFFPFTGPVSEVARFYQEIMLVWMPRREFELGEGGVLELYSGCDQTLGAVSMDLAIPLST